MLTGHRDILLPHHLEDVGVQIALDIGGSLAKVVWFSKSAGEPGGRLNFTKFETVNIQACINFIKGIIASSDTKRLESPSRRTGKKVVIATGGGAHKYADWINAELGVELQKEDEMEWCASSLFCF